MQHFQPTSSGPVGLGPRAWKCPSLHWIYLVSCELWKVTVVPQTSHVPEAQHWVVFLLLQSSIAGHRVFSFVKKRKKKKLLQFHCFTAFQNALHHFHEWKSAEMTESWRSESKPASLLILRCPHHHQMVDCWSDYQANHEKKVFRVHASNSIVPSKMGQKLVL